MKRLFFASLIIFAGGASWRAGLRLGERGLVKNQSSKDKIAFPIRLNDRLAGLLTLVQTGDASLSAPQRAVAKELMTELSAQLARLAQLSPR